MYGLEVRIGSIRGLVALHVYRVLLEEVRSLLAEVDQQSRRVGSATTEPSHMTWAVRHEQDATGLRLRLEPFELDVDQQRVLRAAEAVVVGIHQLAFEPVIPPFYTEDAVSTLAKFAARRGSAGVDRLDLAAVNGQILDEAEVNETVRRNANTSVALATAAVGSIEGVVDVLQGGAKASRRAVVYDLHLRRSVRVRLQPEQVELFHRAWGKHVAVRGLISYNRRGQPIRVDATELLELEPPQPGQRLAELVGVAPAWTGGRPVQDLMHDLRRRGG